MRPLVLLMLMPLVALWAAPAPAQGLFAPVARVGERVVTGYELEQRVRFNTALGAPGDREALSLEQLIDDRLRLIAAERAGIEPTEEELLEGMEEFASRADLSLEEFLAAIAEDGVEPETFRDFVRAGLAYRQLVQGRFGPLVDVSEADVDRALARVEPPGRLQATLSEIILRADTPQFAAEAEALAEQIRGLTSFQAFEEAARQVSVAASRDRGGRLDPLPLGDLPGPVQEQIRELRPGQVSDPISIPDAVVLFQLRALEEVAGAREPARAVDYAAFYIPGGRSPEALAQAAAVDAAVDECDDLYGVAQGLPPERLERGTRPVDAIPADVAAQLALLDENEASAALTRAGGRTLVFLMLCERDPAPEVEASILGRPGAPAAGAAEDEEDAAAGAEEEADAVVGAEAAAEAAAEAEPEAPSRGAVRVGLRNQRLQSFGDALLDELRAEVGVEILARP